MHNKVLWKICFQNAPKHNETLKCSPKQTSVCTVKELNSLAVIQVSPQTDDLSHSNNVSQADSVSQTDNVTQTDNLPPSNNVSQTDSVSQTDNVTQSGVENVSKGTASPQQSVFPHRNLVSQGTNVPETKTLKVPNPQRGEKTSVSQETSEETVLQQKHTTAGPCNKGLMDPQAVCELTVQSATSNEGSAVCMQKDKFTKTGSQSVTERPLQSVTTNEKLVPSQQKAHTPQPVSPNIS